MGMTIEKDPPFMMTMGERVETIINSLLRHGTTSGSLGHVIRVTSSLYRVNTCGKTFLVWNTAHGWTVTFKGGRGDSIDLCEAAQVAWNTGKTMDITKGFPIFPVPVQEQAV